MTDRRKTSNQKALEMLLGLGQSVEALRASLQRKRAREKVEAPLPQKVIDELPSPEESFVPDVSMPVDVRLDEPAVHMAEEQGIQTDPIEVWALEGLTEEAAEVSVVPDASSGDFVVLEPLPPVPEHGSIASVVETVLPPASEEPAWLADLETAEAEEEAAVAVSSPLELVDEEALEDRLDKDLASTIQEETEELLPAIASCLAAGPNSRSSTSWA